MNQIFIKLKELQKKAYAKYSNYKVACLIETDIGLIPGVNVECGVLPLSVCAERNAIANAISQGASKFYKLYLLTDSLDTIGTPCGACRQVITEFFSLETEIIAFNPNQEFKKFLLKDLLPNAWLSKTLNK